MDKTGSRASGWWDIQLQSTNALLNNASLRVGRHLLLTRRGVYLSRLGQFDDARAAFEEAFASLPSHSVGTLGHYELVMHLCAINFLRGEFAANGPVHKLISFAARGRLADFYKPVNKYENRFDSGKKFRALADELLAKDAPAFITACLARDKDGIPKSDIKIMWEETESV